MRLIKRSTTWIAAHRSGRRRPSAAAFARHDEVQPTGQKRLISHGDAVGRRQGAARAGLTFRQNQVGLFDARSGKVSRSVVTLHSLEGGQELVGQEVEVVAHQTPVDGIVCENAVEPLHQSQLLAALRIYQPLTCG
jgi:hypothetical protein